MIANAVKAKEANRLFNTEKYGKLLARLAPKVIRAEAEYDRAIEAIEKLLRKSDGISPEEEQLLDLLSTLVEQYEAKHYAIEPSAPHEMLQHLLEARGMQPQDLAPLFGSSSKAASALSGALSISKNQAKELAQFFHVSVELFIPAQPH